MKKWKNKIKEIWNAINMWLKQHPSALMWLGLVAACVIIQSYIIGLCFSPVEIYSMENIAQVLSTSTEVVSGVYGLTLTGYIFFLERLQEKAEDDELLEDIVALLKKRYHNIVLFLSADCLAVIVFAFSFISYNVDSRLIPDYLYRFWAFETLFLVFTELICIIYFILTVVDPDKIPRISLQYKQKISDSTTELGSLQEFLQDYEDIEEILKKSSERLTIAQIGTNPWKALKHMRGKELVQIRKWINDPLMKKLTKIGQYYSYMVFSQEMIVTKEMCNLAKEVKQELEDIL